MYPTLTITEVATIEGVSRNSILNWADAGMVRLVKPHPGESCKRTDAVGLLSAEVIKLLKRDCSFSIIQPIAQFLATHTPEQIDQECQDGKSLLIYVTGLFGPAFVRPDDATVMRNDTGKRQHHIVLPIEVYWRRVLAMLPRRVEPIESIESEEAAYVSN